MRRRAIVVLVAAAAASACRLVAGLEDVQYVDGDASTEAGTDASLLDGNPIDVRTDTADAGPEHCHDGLRHDFCDDFEGLMVPDERWSGTNVAGSGKLVLDTPADAPSPTHVLRTLIDELDGGSPNAHSAALHLATAFTPGDAGEVPKLVLSFKVRVVRYDPVVTASFGSIAAIGLAFGDILHLYLRYNGSQLEVQPLEIDTSTTDAAAPDYHAGPTTLRVRPSTWTPITVEINARPAGSSGGYTVTVDGQSVSSAIFTPTRPNDVYLQVGVSVPTTAGAGWTAEYDDVTIDYGK